MSLYSEMLITTSESSGIRRHRAYGLSPVITVVREAGLDPVAMLERAGIPADAPDDPEYTLSLREELAFMEDALQALQQPDLGLQLGPRYHLPFYGMLGLAAMTSANLAETFRVVFKYIHLTWSFMNWSLRSEDGVAIIHLQKRRDLGNCYQYMVDRGLAASYTIACDALGYTLPLLEVNVMQPAPAYAERYQEIFRCPVNFSAGSNDFRFEERYVHEPLQQAETESSRIFEAQCEQICAALDEGGGFTEVIRQHLLQLPNQVSSLERIAERLHTTPRTIQRKLAQENTSYHELVENIRRNLAIEYLKTTALSLEDIAARLGYADAPSFSHAFKRWTGSSPGALRA
ncbi:MAG: helix-turn-helix domain-containing protein [Haliea sp.]|nr:helix-turn-helix domain-containing protein [Haliea sp.]